MLVAHANITHWSAKFENWFVASSAQILLLSETYLTDAGWDLKKPFLSQLGWTGFHSPALVTSGHDAPAISIVGGHAYATGKKFGTSGGVAILCKKHLLARSLPPYLVDAVLERSPRWLPQRWVATTLRLRARVVMVCDWRGRRRVTADVTS